MQLSQPASRLPLLKSILFVPALRPRFIASALKLGVSAVFLDLEDAVPAHAKAAARESIASSVEVFTDAGVTCFVRVNRGDLLDLRACATAGVTGIVLPKVDDPDEVVEAARVLRDGEDTCPSIVATIESARGVLHASEIAEVPQVDALFFGAGDFAASSGFALKAEALAIPAAMVALAARAHHKVALGLPGSIGEFADLELLRETARQARDMGYSGSPVIHPKQVPVIEAAFSPTTAEADCARRLVAAFEAGDGGASQADGRLVELPAYLMARAVLERTGQAMPAAAAGGSRP